MIDLYLTSIQKKYLFHFVNLDVEPTISNFAEYFECSRINSKKILDRMVKIGVLYKNENNYELTEIGSSIAENIHSSTKSTSKLLSSVFNISEEESLRISSSLLEQRDMDLLEFFNKKFQRFKNLPKPKQTVNYRELEDILGEGEYKLSFSIYKHSADSKQSSIPLSMAGYAFEEFAKIVISEKSHIVFFTKSLRQSQKGYIKRGDIKELCYVNEDKEHSVSAKNGEIHIPLDIFDTWMYLGAGFFCSNVWFKSKVTISMSSHTQKSNYLLFINLSEL